MTGMDGIRARIQDVHARLAALLVEWNAANQREAPLLNVAEEEHAAACAEAEALLEEQLKGRTALTAQLKERVAARKRRRVARVERAYGRVRQKLEQTLAQRTAAAEASLAGSRDSVLQDLEQKTEVVRQNYAGQVAELKKLQEKTDNLRERVLKIVRTYGLSVDTNPKTADIPMNSPVDFEPATTALRAKLKDVTASIAANEARMGRRPSPLLVYLLLVVLHGVAAAVVRSKFPGMTNLYAVGGSLLVMLGATVSIFHAGRVRAFSSSNALLEQQRQVAEAVQQEELAVIDGEKIERVCAMDDAAGKSEQQIRLEIRTALAHASTRFEALSATISKRCETQFAEAIRGTNAQTAQIQTQHAARLKKLETDLATRRRNIQQQRLDECKRLADEWNKTLAEFSAFGETLKHESRERNPPWKALLKSDWQLPTQFAQDVYVGDVSVDLNSLVERPLPATAASSASFSVSLPLGLSFPLRAGLLIRSSAERRGAAVQILSTALVRLLCSFPAAKAKLTVIDPVGLGQNFASLMHLADYDESIVGGKIWTDPAHIERKLTELTEHMEKVIQKYLRNTYATIEEFNREAGQLAEPYRFLIVADFPTGFGELSLERLNSIVTSGARCGVYTLILQNRDQKIPKPLTESMLKQACVFITEKSGRFVVDDEPLQVGTFAGEEPPAPALLDTLIAAIGRQCKEAARVQVPFDAVTPPANERWTSSAIGGLRLPLGMAGADRLQYMNLGKGTAQHVLIAGKTGSGKSNLFHAMVTNLALWYSPGEVEFYLIDFKKGVEFKTYASHRLPHARVIAIESDREFGVSVLRRLDRELSHRGELFRKARVQDYPSYRAAVPDANLPRALLVIDEFQEYFVDDDAVSQDAALLLDRIVRQGRAFGIHVILGSQTLGGTYSLAKSTLGQMAVRVALQCNESDSYLILGDDNAAAALLSRPGEAIYNEMSGAVEANNPFQAVYLPKEVQDECLRTVQDLANERKQNPAQRAVVFEGSSLSDIGNNGLILNPGVSEHPRVWLGEPNAIKGPTEVELATRAGSNLLVVGQRGEGEVALGCAALLSLAAQYKPGSARFIVFDGSSADADAKSRLKLLSTELPHGIEVADFRRVGELSAELAAELKVRQDNPDAPRMPIYLLVLGLERLRALRNDDEFGYSSDGGSDTPAKQFTSVLTDGPAEGIHAIVWCDTLTNLNRTLSRKTLREFESRALFQMSATDSNELIELPAANRLGLYNALLYISGSGGVEKFRPYGLPDVATLKELCAAVAKTSRGEAQ